MTNTLLKNIFLASILLLFLSFSNENTREKHQFENTLLRCLYETNQGRIDGNYVSYYKNGNKKSEGKFENNYRTGKWTIWDSTGKVQVQREYTDPFTFKTIVSKENARDLSGMAKYTLHYNKDGYIDYFNLKENIIVLSKRIWRQLSPSENSILFENNRLFTILNKGTASKKVTPFAATDDQFRNELRTNPDTSLFKIISFKIKEDWFYDNVRNVSETRIIGICPVAIKKATNDTIDLYWVYLPEIRKYLAQEKVQSTNLPSKIKTVDDLLFFRYFYGKIYKESNVYNRSIAEYKKGEEMAKEEERIEINMIETEHDIWTQ